MVRLVDIAKVAGVTTGTVSSALTGRGRVSDEVRSHIRQLADEMGYQPNPAAQMLKSKYMTDVGILLMGGTSIMVESLMDAFETYGQRTQIEFCRLDAQVLPSIFASGYAKGIVIVGAYPAVVRKFIETHPDFPVVTIWEKSPYCIYSDFYSGTVRAIESLLAHEKRRIAFQLTNTPYEEHRQIAAAVEDCVKKFNLESCYYFSDFSPLRFPQTASGEDCVPWANHILDKEPLPVAFFCSGAIPTRGIIYAALKRGLRIPEDVTIISTAWKREAEDNFPQISSLEQQLGRLGAEAAAMLQRLMTGLPVFQKQVLVDTKLVFRKTT